MSKMDDMRAMREARYRRAGATPPRAGQPATTRSTPGAPAQTDAADAADAAGTTAAGTPARRPAARRQATSPAGQGAAAPAAPAAEGRCGHRAISGRTCTREQGHAAKSHRYS